MSFANNNIQNTFNTSENDSFSKFQNIFSIYKIKQFCTLENMLMIEWIFRLGLLKMYITFLFVKKKKTAKPAYNELGYNDFSIKIKKILIIIFSINWKKLIILFCKSTLKYPYSIILQQFFAPLKLQELFSLRFQFTKKLTHFQLTLLPITGCGQNSINQI